MKRDYLKRVGAVMLSLAVFVAFSFVAAPEAYAAKGGGKTIVTGQVSSSWSHSETYEGNTTSDKSSAVSTYNYNKQGLLASTVDKYGKSVFKHNKKGYITEEKNYGSDGKLESIRKYKVKKNGDVSKEWYYSSYNGFKTPEQTTTYTYYKKGVVKTSTIKTSDGETWKTWFDKKGNLKKEKNSGKVTRYSDDSDDEIQGTYTETVTFKNKLNKKGNAVRTVRTSIYKTSFGDNEKTVTTTTRSFKYKKGRIVKMVEKITGKDSEGKTYFTGTNVETNTYTAAGRIKKHTAKDVYKYSDGEVITNITTTAFTYKKIKVAKKYRKLYKVKK